MQNPEETGYLTEARRRLEALPGDTPPAVRTSAETQLATLLRGLAELEAAAIGGPEPATTYELRGA